MIRQTDKIEFYGDWNEIQKMKYLNAKEREPEILGSRDRMLVYKTFKNLVSCVKFQCFQDTLKWSFVTLYFFIPNE